MARKPTQQKSRRSRSPEVQKVCVAKRSTVEQRSSKCEPSDDADSIKDIFKNGDVNKDGQLSKQELKDILKSVGDWSDKEFEDLYKLADVNQDGKVTYNEFVDWVMSEERVTELIKPAILKFKHVFTRENPGCINDHYKMDRKMLGEGSYGQVCKGQDKVTKVMRAIKAIDITKISDPKRFEEEVAIQQSLDHPNIVKLYEVFKDARCMYLVMELCTGGEMFDRIIEAVESRQNAGEDGRAFDERGAATYMQQILGAMRYIHGQKFAHRDIKPENFLLQNKTPDAPVKVIDFGLAARIVPGKKMKTKAGTPFYVAPEVLDGSYDEKCDIWSCGVMTYILLCGYPPFYGDKDSEVLKMVKKGDYEFVSPDWDGISAEAKDMISQMFQKKPSRRPTAEKLLEHPWLKNRADKVSGVVSGDFCKKLKDFTGCSKLKKVALTLIAQQLKEEDIEDLKNTFLLLDENRDGTLTVREFEQGMKKHDVVLPKEMQAPTLRKTLVAMDTDGSGMIDYTEFIAATIQANKYLKKEVLWSAFRTFDKDGDGNITKAELKQLLEGQEEQPVLGSLDKQINQMFQESDLDGDGNISWDEFTKMMSQQPGAPKPRQSEVLSPPVSPGGRRSVRPSEVLNASPVGRRTQKAS